MASHPLTHHEIITLVEPFTRQGYHPDLAATDRLERRLVFKPVERSFETAEGAVDLHETLQLDNKGGGAFRLTRTLACVTPSEKELEAKLDIEGTDPADLLACVESIAPERQFRFGPGFQIARSYRLKRGSGFARDGSPAVQTTLTAMAAHVEDLFVTATAPTHRIDDETAIEIYPTAGDYKAVPDDLLAVLGWDWGLIKHRQGVWKSSLRMKGREPRRSNRAERKLDGMVEHLAQTFAEAPSRFHERLAGARWSVTLRRAMPLLISLGLIGGAAASAYLPLADDSPVRMMMLNLPGLLMVIAFCMKRLPVIEVPPIPRPLRERVWREPSSLAPAMP